MPSRARLSRLYRLEEPDVVQPKRSCGCHRVGVNQKTQDRVDLSIGNEADQLSQDQQIARPTRIQSRHINACLRNLIGHWPSSSQTRHFSLRSARIAQANGQFAHHRRRAADLEIRIEQKKSPQGPLV